MKLPNARDLNEEQEAVYLYAPEDGRLLVSGPPGTGKTVLAILRALEIARRGQAPVVAMFNRVLEAYSSNRIPDGAREAWEKIRFDTVHGLFRELWLGLRLPLLPDADRVVLNVPFDEKDEAKALGARWNRWVRLPGRPRAGCWAVDRVTFERNASAFARWDAWCEAPSDQDGRDIDWDAYLTHLATNATEADWSAIGFDALILDEGQDFPPAFFRLVSYLSQGTFGNPKKPVVMVLADENQRLTAKRNSRIDEIEKALSLPPERHYRLKTNFRNTRQVALVARHFYAGMATGMPELPVREGPVPELRTCRDTGSARAKIIRYAENNPRHEIGVIVLDNDQCRERYYQELTRHAPGNVRVQTYSSVLQQHRNARDLGFDEPAITVLNRASCKGLEFDAVFIVSIDEARLSEGHDDFFRMGMYVMSSRSRNHLSLFWNGRREVPPPVLAFLPKEPLVRICG